MTLFADLIGNASTNRLPPPTVYVEPTWEYKHVVRTLKADGPLREAELNALGVDGWELAAAFVERGQLHVYFKRLAR
jgi:hypothetical protein